MTLVPAQGPAISVNNNFPPHYPLIINLSERSVKGHSYLKKIDVKYQFFNKVPGREQPQTEGLGQFPEKLLEP